MKKPLPEPIWVTKSPWLDSTKKNLFKDEFILIKDLKIDPWLEQTSSYFKPLNIYKWIEKHHGVPLFFKGLARYAPMFSVFAYNGRVALWISPPPSGYGNAIYMVMGHDKTETLRLVGGNYFIEPRFEQGEPLIDTDFFAKYDKSDDRDKQRLVQNTVAQSISSEDKVFLQDISRQCANFHTMAIYITVLTSEGSLFHATKAVIEGDKPADFSYEWFGEIK